MNVPRLLRDPAPERPPGAAGGQEANDARGRRRNERHFDDRAVAGALEAIRSRETTRRQGAGMERPATSLEPAAEPERWTRDETPARPWIDTRQRRPNPLLNSETTSVPGPAPLEVRQVVDAVCRSMPLDGSKLAAEFFPAHLPVALIDATFRSRLRHGERPAPVAERYCRHFGIARTRTDRRILPRIDEQESLEDLIRRVEELGVDEFASRVLRSRHRFPGMRITRAENVLRAANALRCIGVNVLQDAASRRPSDIHDALRPVPGIGDSTVRMFLMFTGDEDFVLGDGHLRRFVASAIGRRAVSAAQAEDLVRQSAYELILSPRFLDCEIWRYGVAGAGVARPPEPFCGK